MQSFIDYFRCPGGLADLRTSADLSAEPGYFRFGTGTCYGRVAGTRPAAAIGPSLPEARIIRSNGCGPMLPFDLTEVVTNLREERYQRTDDNLVSKVTAGGVSHKLYYLLRPLLPVAVRKHLQRIRLSGWDRIGFPSWPLDTSVDDTMKGAMKLAIEARGGGEIPFVWFWPDGAPAAAIITHDVEAPAGRSFCEELMAIDEDAGLRASFQLVPEVRYETSRELCDELRSRGFEANVHDLNHDGHLFKSREQFVERATQINRYAKEFECRGFRAACMYRQEQWLDVLDVSYDMSVPNVAHLEPQGGGCCTVMPYFIGNIVELPLTTIQDYSLFHILNSYSVDLWKAQIDLLIQNNGLITILTHPDYLIESRAREAYTALLAEVARVRDELSVWAALPGDVERWWRNRNEMTLERRGDGWCVKGPDSARARVAYASIRGDRVEYRIQ